MMPELAASRDGKLAPPSFVSVEHADLYYGADNDVLALQDTTFSMVKGEFVAVVGPSGCGKSTLLKLISGLRLATAGRVIVDGQPVRKPLKNIGMAFQNPALLPWRTTLDNLLLPLQVVRPHRQNFARKRGEYTAMARALLAKVGLEGVDKMFPWQLSGGMQQRVSLCRSLIYDPQLLLLDEPFGALDAFTREELWETLQLLWQERHFTVLLVTHDLAEAVYLADTVLVMSRRPGKVTYSAKIDLPRPRSEDTRFTPAFVDLVRDLRHHIAHARAIA